MNLFDGIELVDFDSATIAEGEINVKYLVNVADVEYLVAADCEDSALEHLMRHIASYKVKADYVDCG